MWNNYKDIILQKNRQKVSIQQSSRLIITEIAQLETMNNYNYHIQLNNYAS